MEPRHATSFLPALERNLSMGNLNSAFWRHQANTSTLAPPCRGILFAGQTWNLANFLIKAWSTEQIRKVRKRSAIVLIPGTDLFVFTDVASSFPPKYDSYAPARTRYPDFLSAGADFLLENRPSHFSAPSSESRRIDSDFRRLVGGHIDFDHVPTAHSPRGWLPDVRRGRELRWSLTWRRRGRLCENPSVGPIFVGENAGRICGLIDSIGIGMFLAIFWRCPSFFLFARPLRLCPCIFYRVCCFYVGSEVVSAPFGIDPAFVFLLRRRYSAIDSEKYTTPYRCAVLRCSALITAVSFHFALLCLWFFHICYSTMWHLVFTAI